MKTIGFAMCGSFCTFEKAVGQMEALSHSYAILPLMSQNAYTTDTRFGKAQDWVRRVEGIAGRPVLHTIVQAEPIGPKGLVDLLAVAPCTGNTLSKIAAGITDTPVTMAVKSALRIGIPVVLCCATNDAMAASGPNLLRLLNTKNVYLVPLRQDDPVKKPVSSGGGFHLAAPGHRPGPGGKAAPARVPAAAHRRLKGGENFFIYKIPVLGYDKGYHSRAAPGCGLFVKRTRGVCSTVQNATAPARIPPPNAPTAKTRKLRPLEGEDMVRLHRADQYTAGLLEQRFAQEGVGFQMEPFSGGWVSYLYDNDVLPTDKLVLVRWSDYDRAKELSSQVRRQVEAERAAVGQEEEGETFEDMPRKKRILVQVVSVLAFILLIMAAVYGADFAANWLKGLWS